MKGAHQAHPSEYDPAIYHYFVGLLTEFLSIPQSEVEFRLKMGIRDCGRSIAEDWQRSLPETCDEVVRIYQDTYSYIYDLAADHCLYRRPAVWNPTARRIDRRGPEQCVLVYGDGIGTDSIAIARLGHRVTYYDLPGNTSEFARFRFLKDGLGDQIAVITEPSRLPAAGFDAVVCIEVLEHVTDPPAVMKQIYDLLKSGGIALITESFESVGPEFPSHLPENLKYAGKIHQLMEGFGFASTYYNSEPINRPMEFTKAEANAAGFLLTLKGRVRRAIHTRWRYMTHQIG